MIKVLLSDSNITVRKGLRNILSACEDITVAGEAGTASEILKALQENKFDLLLLDISMPGTGGVEMIRRIKNERPDMLILALSTYPVEGYDLHVKGAGAVGCLAKKDAPNSLIEAILSHMG